MTFSEIFSLPGKIAFWKIFTCCCTWARHTWASVWCVLGRVHLLWFGSTSFSPCCDFSYVWQGTASQVAASGSTHPSSPPWSRSSCSVCVFLSLFLLMWEVKMLVTWSSRTLCDPMDCSPPAPLSMEFSRQEYWSHALLQGIFQTQGLNLGLLHCRQILDRLSHRESTLTYCLSAGVSVPRGQWSRFAQGCVLLGLPWWSSG